MPGRRGPQRRPIGLQQATQPSRGSLIVSRSAIVTQAVAGSAAYDEVTFVVSNGGPGPWANPQFAITYGSGSNWLSLTTTTAADGSIVVTPTITPGANTAGVKTATITITDAKVLNSGVTVSVTFTVTAVAPILSLSQSSLVLSVQDESTGGAGTITITNTGGATGATPAVGTITGTAASYLGTPTITGTGPWTLTVTPDATGGTPGNYTATIPITLTGATTVNVSVSLTVTAQAAQAVLAISRAVSDAAWTTGSATPGSESAALYSANTTPLIGPTIVSSVYSGPNTGWANAYILGSQLVVDYDVSGSHASNDGMSVLTTTISDPAAGNTVVHETYFKVNAAPASNILSVSSSAVSVPVTVGQSTNDVNITVSNAGTGGFSGLGTVTATLTSSVAWVRASYVGGSSTGTITLSFTTQGLSAGTYTNTLTVSASGATNSPRTIPISVVVSASANYPMLLYTLPIGVTQNTTTGYCEGVPVGIQTTRPSNWNAAATYNITSASTPTPSAAFQNALTASASQNSPVIQIEAGLTLSGMFTVPTRTGTGWLVVRTANYASLPAQGTRVYPPTDAVNMPTISSPSLLPCLRMIGTDTRTHFLGIRVTDTATTNLGLNYYQIACFPHTYSQSGGNIIANDVADQSNQPTDIWFDQCIGAGKPTGGSMRFIWASMKRLAVTDCYLSEYKINGGECQAILVSYGGYSYYFKNTYFEAAGENFMAEGVPSPYNVDAYNPTDLYFLNCEFRGRWKWFSWHPTYDNYNVAAKNLFEIKHAKRVLLEACVFHETGVDAQAGYTTVFKTASQYGGTQVRADITQDVQMLDCLHYDCQGVWSVQGSPNPQSGIPNDRHHLINCLFHTINKQPNTASGYVTSIQNGSTNITVERITHVLNGGDTPQGCITVSGGACNNIKMTDCLIPIGQYGIFGQGASAEGTAALDLKWGSYQFTRNALNRQATGARAPSQAAASKYPAGNFFPVNETAIDYVNLGGSSITDFALKPSSPYYAAGANGAPLGCDIARLATRVAGVISPG